MRRRSTFLLLVLYTLTLLVALPSARGQTSVETELFDLINGGRDNQLTLHTGLRTVAREHAVDMSEDGELNHNGAERRIGEAPPDPHEQNGAPDDGFTGTWCENVAYVRGAPENEVARRMYDAWTNSPSHNRCMNNEDINAAGIGLYFDGTTYWATYESAVDRTLPGSEAVETSGPTATPTPTAAPIIPTLRTEPPERTEPPTPTPQTTATATPSEEPTESAAETAAAPAVSVQTGSRVSTSGLALAPALPSAKRTGVGWPELAATMAVIGLAGEFLRRLTRRVDRNETT